MKYFKKSLGQNFLIDKNVINKITSLVKIKDKNIVEIGPGNGALTNEIFKRKPKSLILIEKDHNLINDLKRFFVKEKKVKIFNEDVLQFDIDSICKKNTIIFGNLPYNISSQILVKILKVKNLSTHIEDIILMFQKELGEKITGKFSTKNYGRLSILTNFRLKILKKFLVSPFSFFPKPKVLSVVIHFQPKKKTNHRIKEIKSLEKITNIIFSNRRKMVNKNIKKVLSSKKIDKIPDFNLNLRPSEIKPEIYYKITELYEKI